MVDLNLNLDDGREKIYINKEKYGEDRVIYLNLSDINIFTRADEARKNINKFLSNNLSDLEAIDASIAMVKKADKYIRKQVDYIFDYEVSDAVFGKTFATANVGGRTYIEAFLQAIMPLIEDKIKEYEIKTQKNISKYTDKYTK